MPRSSHMDEQKEMLSTSQMHIPSILVYEEVHIDWYFSFSYGINNI
jgi:hypothetical protein